MTTDMPEGNGKAKTGFAAMSPEGRRDVSRMGGKALPNEKRSFSTNKASPERQARRAARMCHPKSILISSTAMWQHALPG